VPRGKEECLRYAAQRRLRRAVAVQLPPPNKNTDREGRYFCLPNTDKKVKNRGKSEQKVNFIPLSMQ